MSSGVKHGRSIRPSSGVAKAQDDFGNEHLVARTLPTTTQDASIHDLFAWSRQAFPERWRQECRCADREWTTITHWRTVPTRRAGRASQHAGVTEALGQKTERDYDQVYNPQWHSESHAGVSFTSGCGARAGPGSLVHKRYQRDSYRAGWTPDKGNHARAVRHLNAIYRGAQDTNHAACGAHADVEWISTDISYGLFLSDHSVLDITESQLVILPAIMCQDLKGPTDWHLRGCLRLGLTREEVDAVQRVVERIVTHGGGKLSQIGSVWDIQDE
nr:hypothetical protein L203_04404 [Cryptococcus depauperatus CBS 7841]